MASISFEWDESKNRSNQKKHRVSFEEAQTVFLDEHAVQFFDEAHSGEEDRFLMLGLSSHLRVLLVVHAYREEDEVIRIISARAATGKERELYKGSRP
ncbi:MAG: BrnT family toxin [Planctomycetes bacterium]|nr:BrnT family toxin [Planctomycetota bacterium]